MFSDHADGISPNCAPPPPPILLYYNIICWPQIAGNGLKLSTFLKFQTYSNPHVFGPFSWILNLLYTFDP